MVNICVYISQLLLVFGIVASNCASIKSWMNDGGEFSFDRIVGEMAVFYFKKKF